MLKFLPFALALGLFALPAQEAAPATALHDAMETLQANQRVLKKLIADPAANRDELLETLHAMQDAAFFALGESPPSEPEALDETALALWHVGYKRTMLQLADTILFLEQATLEGNGEALSEGYAKLSESKKTGHDNYRDL